MSEPSDEWPKFQLASDVATRDGVGLEMYDDGGLIAEAFRSDDLKTLTVTCFREDISFVYLEKMIALARLRLGEFEDGEPLPAPLS